MPRVDNGHGFEWRSAMEFYGYPLVCIAAGKDQNGRMRVAKGWLAIGQFAIGVVTFAQVGIGLLFGFGQCIFGITAVAQAAITLLFGVGQIATGYVAIGQLALGYYALGQVAVGYHTWMQGHSDPAAVAFFRQLWQWLRHALS